jgi:two-component system chemotaxis response regulator CheB
VRGRRLYDQGEVNAQRDRFELVVVGASAGGVEALRAFVAGLPPDLDAAVCVVLHVLETASSALPEILTRSGPLPARHPQDGEAIVPGTIAIAPPGCHLIVEEGRLRVTRAPKENGHRPAIDPLFRTAARTYGHRVAGVILSGSLDDGTAGLRSIKICGGTTLVQDPDEALYASMPRSAVAHVEPDLVLPVAALGPALGRLVAEGSVRRREAAVPADSAAGGGGRIYTCPDCGGPLEEQTEAGLLHYRCQVGHAYSPESLVYLQSQQLESALWAALRALEERAELARRIVGRLNVAESGGATARSFQRQATDADTHAGTLRQLLEDVEAIEQLDPAAGVAEAGR